MRRAGLTARKSVDPASCLVCATRPGSCSFSHGFGQQVASLVLWFGSDDWVIDQINSEATRTLKPRPNSHYTHPFYGPFSGTTQVSRYQKGKTNLDFTEARDSEWQWHQLGHMQVCTSLQTDNHTSTQTLSFLQAGCPSCRPTNSVKALQTKKIC